MFFVVQNAIVNNTGKWAVPIAANNADWVLDRFGEKGRWLHRWITAFERGFLHGGGTIPVEKSRERTKKHFLLLIDRAVKQKKDSDLLCRRSMAHVLLRLRKRGYRCQIRSYKFLETI